MSKKEILETALNKAEAKEKEYNWMNGAELYEKALNMVDPQDFSRKAQIHEKIGFCFHKSAMQAESHEEFKEKMQRAIEAYAEAQESFKRLNDEQNSAKTLRCSATAKFLEYWLTTSPSEKRRLLDESLESYVSASTVFWNSENMSEYVRTYNELQPIFFHKTIYEWDRQTLKEILENGIVWGEKATKIPPEKGDSRKIAEANLTLAICLTFFKDFFVEDAKRQEQLGSKAVNCLHNAIEFSEKNGDDYTLGMSYFWLGASEEENKNLRDYEKALECGNKTKDNFLKARALDLIAFVNFWKAIAVEDPDQRRKVAEKAMQYYEQAEHHSSIISFTSPRGGVIAPPGGYADYYFNLSTWETDLGKKREFLEESEKAGIKALKLAEEADVPVVTYTMFHMLSKIFQARANIEPDFENKKNLLEKALKYREKSIEVQEHRNPLDYWNLGVMHNYLAEIKAEIGYSEPNFDDKKKLLDDAISDKEKCLELIAKTMPYYERIGSWGNFASLFRYQDTYSTLLFRSYELSKDPAYLRKAMRILENAIDSISKLDMISRKAESYWKIAKTLDILGEHLEAAENFERASECYMKAVEKIPQLKDLYRDHAHYMQAWNEIEKARHHHLEKKYGLAREHYEKAAGLHASVERWKYLSSNYLAWAKLEEAEDLSRREQIEEAKDHFQQAITLFEETGKSIRAAMGKIRVRDEKEMATELMKASDTRKQYCLGRIAIEEAKIFDRQNDYVASSKKYGFAAETFQKIAETETEQSRKEIQLIIYLCQAWQKMMTAEAQASPSMYGEAAELFKQAKEHTSDQPTSLLALCNSNFCKALEAGTEFESSRDMGMYLTAKRHLEAAVNCYLKAGFKTSSDYAKAIQHLFDAYMHMDKAGIETNPERKAQHYEMAEKLLEASAGSYVKAKHPEKNVQVQRLLESVREERQLALSLTEVLHAPTIASATTSFSTPTPNKEEPVGLEQFENADIQANLILRPTEAKVGEDVDFEIELTNTGKAPALLMKVEDIVPEGFEIKEAPTIYRVEDSYLNLKGKKLEPLRTEEVRIVAKALSRGMFLMKPRILYLDDTGKQKSHEPQPVSIKVKELGIKGWIKGER